mmetsp:Transcript_27969/g.78228  ORF Transcript_27969/g.78228 Transcript_27969/m.78228 type:complete len:287 (+) Transcript_27969:230-1090(+)
MVALGFCETPPQLVAVVAQPGGVGRGALQLPAGGVQLLLELALLLEPVLLEVTHLLADLLGALKLVLRRPCCLLDALNHLQQRVLVVNVLGQIQPLPKRQHKCVGSLRRTGRRLVRSRRLQRLARLGVLCPLLIQYRSCLGPFRRHLVHLRPLHTLQLPRRTLLLHDPFLQRRHSRLVLCRGIARLLQLLLQPLRLRKPLLRVLLQLVDLLVEGLVHIHQALHCRAFIPGLVLPLLLETLQFCLRLRQLSPQIPGLVLFRFLVRLQFRNPHPQLLQCFRMLPLRPV